MIITSKFTMIDGSVCELDDVQKRIDDFKEWSAENLGEKTGLWYAPYLERIGELLKKFEFEDTDDLKENFFYYGTYQEFESVYRKIFGGIRYKCRTDN